MYRESCRDRPFVSLSLDFFSLSPIEIPQDTPYLIGLYMPLVYLSTATSAIDHTTNHVIVRTIDHDRPLSVFMYHSAL
jgi:hypothetical protein